MGKYQMRSNRILLDIYINKIGYLNIKREEYRKKRIIILQYCRIVVRDGN